MTNFIWITTEKEMLHKYPNAPKEVDFLRNIHRHLFKFKVYIEVKHNERDIEFIMFKREVNNLLDKYNMETASCETISDGLYLDIKNMYPNRHIKIEISEDGENGILYDYPVNQ